MKSRKKSRFKDSLKVAGAIALGIGNVYAGTLQEDVQRVRQEVRKNAQSCYVSSLAPYDTVFVWNGSSNKDNLEIRAGSDFTAFYLEGDNGGCRYSFDVGNDGFLDRLILTDSRVEEHERGQIDLEGLSATPNSLDIFKDLNDIKQEMEGETPYNTRKVYLMKPDNSGVYYNFSENTSEKIGPDVAHKMGEYYKLIIDKTKKIFGISN